MVAELRTNLLYFGDNLGWLRDFGAFPDESVDLVYLDPPFNSNRNYNVLFKESDVRESEAQIHAFEDTWSWDREGNVQETYNDFWMTAPEKPKQMLKALVAALGHNDVTAYLTMMAPRLVELHRVLKPTGSLYLHCDPTASHYLKIMLDAIFGPQRFVNEVVWKRTSAHSNVGSKFAVVQDRLLFYTKSNAWTWNQSHSVYTERYVESHYSQVDSANGRRFTTRDLTASMQRASKGQLYEWKGFRPPASRCWAYSMENMEDFERRGLLVYSPRGMPRLKLYLDDMPGTPTDDVWTDIPPINSQSLERLGFPTQKPLVLLERIITSSSNPGDVVLDPFCGCGTAVHAAQKLGRRWIGIDITPLATNLIKDRLERAFKDDGLKVPIEGWPVDMAGAVALAAQEDKYHFQDWAVIQAGGRPAGGERKKGADKGVDGVIPFVDGIGGKGSPKRGIISVKAGNTGPAHVRDLAGVVASDADAAFGVFICRDAPTKPMTEAALEAGTWVSDFDGFIYPRLQILSAQDLIEGRQVRMPQAARTPLFAEAGREKKRTQQGRLV